MRSVAPRDHAPDELSSADRVEKSGELGRRPRVALDEASIERGVARVAVRFTRCWGFTTVGMVSERFRLTTTCTESRSVVARRALALFRDLRWLDPAHEWFTLLEVESPPKAALSKIIAVTGGVPREDVLSALGKRHWFRDAPHDVVCAYLEELVRGHNQSRPWNAPTTSESIPTKEEQVLIGAFRSAGGSADLEILRRHAKRSSISEEALTRTLSNSPLFVRVARSRYRLLGAPIPIRTRRLITSGRWEATL
jgi:hypothetical protein